MNRVALTAAVVALGACGGDDAPRVKKPAATPTAPSALTATPTATATPKPITHAAVVRALNRYCDQVNRYDGDDERFKTAGKAGDYEEAASILDDITRKVRPHVRRLDRLEVPAGDRAAFGRFLRTQPRSIALTPRVSEGLRENDIQALTTYAAVAERQKQARLEAALDLGANRCGR